jgi:hypothetical protein
MEEFCLACGTAVDKSKDVDIFETCLSICVLRTQNWCMNYFFLVVLWKLQKPQLSVVMLRSNITNAHSLVP